MKAFYCTCGQRIYFDNTECLSCGRALRFDPDRQTMVALRADGNEWIDDRGTRFRDCRNRVEYRACNWVMPAQDNHRYCRSCRLNDIVPHLERPGNVRQWSKLEAAKRHLLYTLLQLGLPVQSEAQTTSRDLAHGELPGLSFAFLEDTRSNANVQESYVATGHARGLITLNLIEADDAYREKTRQQLGEFYRTLLGHFRHEIGHYYYDLLVRGSAWESEFRDRFGDPDLPYHKALKAHYAKGPAPDWRQRYISAYAGSHPLEDWAETWAHYLHMQDTLDTARAFGLPLSEAGPGEDSLDVLVRQWVQLSLVLNSLNRSMGLSDAYPFVLSDAVVAKLRMIHRVIQAATQ